MASQSKVTPSGFTPYIRPGGAKPAGKGLPWAYGRGLAQPSPANTQPNPANTQKSPSRKVQSIPSSIPSTVKGAQEYKFSFKKGGKVKKTGTALVHKGEVVVPKKKVGKMTYAQVAKSVKKSQGY